MSEELSRIVSDDSADEESREEYAVRPVHAEPPEGYSDIYLDTISRPMLDFDFEKLCSVSLSNLNVYACLVCGKYYQGRGRSSYAYLHSVDEDHHVYINMATLKVYVLPESYEVTNKALDDIKFVVNPTYNTEDVRAMDKTFRQCWDLSGKKYVPGFIGLNNIKENDYVNVIVHALAHVAPLRNFLMLEDLALKPELAQRFSILVRKIWNPRSFKSHVSPHELLQQISQSSNKRFSMTKQSDPIDFLTWFIENLHNSLRGSKKEPGSNIMRHVFQGSLRIESQQITAKADVGDRLMFEESAEVKCEEKKFSMLTLDLPPAPLFQDDVEGSSIPQVALTTILNKYNGRQSQELLGHRKRYRLLNPLPPYLIFHIKRFSKNKFVEERNPTIVTFPIRSLDMAPYVAPDMKWTGNEPIWYDLVANVTHESVAKSSASSVGRGGAVGNDEAVSATAAAGGGGGQMGGGGGRKHVYRVQVRDKSRDQWIEIQDLFVDEKQKETLFLGESYIQIWEKRKSPGNK